MTSRNWFDVDKAGLAKLIDGRGKVFLLHELVSNAWDTDSTKVVVLLEKLPGEPKARITVTDDHPDGFKNLAHAFTLFAESEKKGLAEKRGRFNLGEKLVLALCLEAKITTTTGTVLFDGDGRRNSREKTEAGSVFTGVIKMTTAEFEEAIADFRKVLPPRQGPVTRFQGEVLAAREPVAVFTETLPTVISDGEGVIRKSARKTTIEVYEVRPGEVASIYEMGIPVVETGDKYHLSIGQKVPLTMERDNVPPSYLKLVRALVVNELHEKLTETDAKSVWVTQALGSESIRPEAVRSVITSRFGEDVVTYDPSDKESNHKAAANDFQVVHGGVLPAEVWENVRKAEAIKPAGQVFPTYSGSAPSTPVPEEDLTENHRRVRKLAIDLAQELCSISISVRFFKGPQVDQAANYGHRSMGFNLSKLSKSFFDLGNNFEGVIDLIIHELGHETEASHLSEAYHKAITKMAGRITKLALNKPELFQ